MSIAPCVLSETAYGVGLAVVEVAVSVATLALHADSVVRRMTYRRHFPEHAQVA